MTPDEAKNSPFPHTPFLDVLDFAMDELCISSEGLKEHLRFSRSSLKTIKRKIRTDDFRFLPTSRCLRLERNLQDLIALEEDMILFSRAHIHPFIYKDHYIGKSGELLNIREVLINYESLWKKDKGLVQYTDSEGESYRDRVEKWNIYDEFEAFKSDSFCVAPDEVKKDLIKEFI